ncbi:MAG: SDR family NAD(P)-dependent oxidoreductase [Halomonas sp.]|nr:SDR family NAD(P)-dependent oxidoreductase [Halomonas sp.]MDN6298255.1 SDR family NAD(P)-dependent oxidoreductase [Halomonas sp.]MDN6315493.1 SDR family NAD(P)-dependent oxidoreductase [Halomonas sp.]MDN6336844.1 SDR family NAD(P)-dependent oxidoreductase [Halomonas sp.]
MVHEKSQERVLLITGASSGIGVATARAAADKKGYRLVLAARSVDKLEALAADRPSHHRQLRRDLDGAAAGHGGKGVGRLDAVFTNVGRLQPGRPWSDAVSGVETIGPRRSGDGGRWQRVSRPCAARR